jgi:hypothetical protein
MIRHRQIQAKQSDDGADQPFGLPERQTENSAPRQRGGDRQGRVLRLPPGVVRACACQAAIASSVNQTVRLPRCRKAASYSGQFVIRYRRFGI